MIIKLLIDRFEGKYAILESQDKDSIIFNFPYEKIRGQVL